MSDSEDDYEYDYSDASSDEGEDSGHDEVKSSQQSYKSPQEGDSDHEDDMDKKPAAKKYSSALDSGEKGGASVVKTPTSKNANANPNAPPAGSSVSGKKNYDHSPMSDFMSPDKNPNGLKLMEVSAVGKLNCSGARTYPNPQSSLSSPQSEALREEMEVRLGKERRDERRLEQRLKPSDSKRIIPSSYITTAS